MRSEHLRIFRTSETNLIIGLGADFKAKDEEYAIRNALRIACHVAPFHAATYYNVHVKDGKKIAEFRFTEGLMPAELVRMVSTPGDTTEDDDGILSCVLGDEMPAYVDDYQNHPNAAPDYLGTRMYECCFIPIHLDRPSGKQLVGILAAYNTVERVGQISPQAITLLEAAVYQLQTSLEYKDAQMQLESSLTLQNALYRSIRQVTSARSVPHALDALFHALSDSFAVQAANVTVAPSGQHTQHVYREFGWRGGSLDLDVIRNAAAHWFAEVREVPEVSAPDLHASLDELIRGEMMPLGVRDHLVAPLMSSGHFVGYLICYWQEPVSQWIRRTVMELCSVFAGVYLSLIETQRALDARIQAVSTLGIALEMRDGETFGHTQRVVSLMQSFISRVNLHSTNDSAVIGAYLHDVGKIIVPDGILQKPGPLTPDERSIIELHTIHGHDIAQRLPFVQPLSLDIILSHHERWDGSGYPNHLGTTEIPVMARMFSLIDVYDALTHQRPYKRAWTHVEALDYIATQAGRQFDPELAHEFSALVDDAQRTTP